MTEELKTEILFNMADSKSIISYWVGGIPKTVYTYHNGFITMSKRIEKHENTFQGYLDGLEELLRWLGKLKIFSPELHPPTEYVLNLRFDNGILHHTHYLNQRANGKGKIEKKKNILMKACFCIATQKITFFPRPEIQVSYSDFRIAIIQAKYFAQQARAIS